MLANPVDQSLLLWLVQRIRQQAGSYRPYIRRESLLTASRIKPVPHPRSYPFSLLHMPL